MQSLVGVHARGLRAPQRIAYAPSTSVVQPALIRRSQQSLLPGTSKTSWSLPNAATRRGSGACCSQANTSVDTYVDPEPAPNQSRLALYFFLWYAFNVVFNILNKSTLNAFPMPWFIATWQLAASGLCMLALWALRLHPLPKLPPGFLQALMPVAFFHTIGHVTACVSFSKMAVSFTHIIKASEPVFTVALSGPLLGASYPVTVWLSLIPIVAGCSLAAMKEVSFGWGGFNYAMASNLGMVLRGIYSKKCLKDFKDMDGINLFGLISIASLVYCIPAALVIESAQWSTAMTAAKVQLGGTWAFAQLLLGGGLFYHLYNQLSYMVLNQGVSPVTFSVGNTMKRVAVIVSSVMFFKNPVSIMNWAGSATAIFGTYLYSLSRIQHPDNKR